MASVAGLRAWRAMRWRDGKTVALVATMGNLHAGHAALIRRAREIADFVLVSVFVNPTQFGPGEDYSGYPRSLAADHALSGESGADAVFAPSLAAVYPGGEGEITRVSVPGLTQILCGASRPGHFDGVTGVVTRLFHLAQPDFAIFGEKDYQQLVILRRMTADLLFGIEIVAEATVRASDGLALSSRNQYLEPAERARAPALYAALEKAAAALHSGARASDVEAGGLHALEAAGFRPEYFSVRRADDLGVPQADSQLRVLAAAWLGKARLIDNIAVPPQRP
ncbi:MAG TPA: pantoate--beta-alanine ligase [Gammaproteobacteria bacterium]|nr:pantoate--beta-alanine ligase [Gammaproteobacteria bacterium]